jgi:hypothetical protein
MAAAVLLLLVLSALPGELPSWTGYAIAGVLFTAVYIHIFRTWRANRRAQPAPGEANTAGWRSGPPAPAIRPWPRRHGWELTPVNGPPQPLRDLLALQEWVQTEAGTVDAEHGPGLVVVPLYVVGTP